ncbi:MAG: hypothetical protein JKY65_14480 [Planctomycetes bacterium]|nr:hypothetical protein [Planctomycetota bacterium]
MDRELIDLRRRWEESGSVEDREHYFQAEARAQGVSAEWIGVRLGVEGYRVARLEAGVRGFFETEEMWQEKKGYYWPHLPAFRAVVREGAGSWFPGLAEDWNPAWCPCHCLPKTPEEIPRAVERVLGQVNAVQSYYVKLIALGDAAPSEADPLDEARALGGAVIELVIEATGCNETWYHEVSIALEFVLLGRGITIDLDEVEQLVSDSFSSWVAPAPAARAAVLEAYASASSKAGLRGAR